MAGASSTRKRQRDDPRRADDALEVVCRLTPYNGPNPCLVVPDLDENVVRVIPPPDAVQRNGKKHPIHGFNFGVVFDDSVPQKKVFDRCAVDLIKQLVSGKNALLFTYGVTGSGKTYTMAGNSRREKAGILPRTLDVVFNSLPGRVPKCVFQPDGRNGFCVINEKEAEYRRKQEDMQYMDCSQEVADRQPETKSVDGAHEDYCCAVFVSYIEIYNNYVYDLLDEQTSSNPISLDVRVDVRNSVYVDRAREVEVESADEALEVFIRGEQGRRTSHTLLNKNSSRSHSVFTIRVVQAPYSADSDYPVSDVNKIVISQMSLVDLAGSERAKRTLNTGERLAEASSINNSLLVLRRCFEKLRENQRKRVSQPVPYRDSKLTTMFKNYFEGSGKIRMIICANPRPDDFEENLNVLAFAEQSQSIQVQVGDDVLVNQMDGPRPPVPRWFYSKWNREVDRLEPASVLSEADRQMPDYDANDDDCIRRLRDWTRMNTAEVRDMATGLARTVTSAELSLRYNLSLMDYRALEIVEHEKQKAEDDRALSRLLAEGKQAKREIHSLRSRLRRLEEEDEEAVFVEEEQRKKRKVEKERLKEQSRTLQQVRQICEGAATQSTPSVATLRTRFNTQETRGGGGTPGGRVRDDLAVGNSTQQSSSSTESRRQERERVVKTSSNTPGGGPGFYNPRYQHRRSKSVPRFLDHQPVHRVPTGGVLRVRQFPNSKTTSQPEVHHLQRSTGYMLTHQEVDKEGNISTSVVKSFTSSTGSGSSTRTRRSKSSTSFVTSFDVDVEMRRSQGPAVPVIDFTTRNPSAWSWQGEVIPTAGGGTAVMFNDVERITHEDPHQRR